MLINCKQKHYNSIIICSNCDIKNTPIQKEITFELNGIVLCKGILIDKEGTYGVLGMAKNTNFSKETKFILKKAGFISSEKIMAVKNIENNKVNLNSIDTFLYAVDTNNTKIKNVLLNIFKEAIDTLNVNNDSLSLKIPKKFTE